MCRGVVLWSLSELRKPPPLSPIFTSHRSVVFSIQACILRLKLHLPSVLPHSSHHDLEWSCHDDALHDLTRRPGTGVRLATLLRLFHVLLNQQGGKGRGAVSPWLLRAVTAPPKIGIESWH